MAKRPPAEWVLLAYRLPREPSTPRISAWRNLRRLGATQLGDGVAALPHDEQTREALDWLADEIVDAGGEASVWLARPTTRGQGRALADAMSHAIAAEYSALIAEARAAARIPDGARRRRLARLRRELQRIHRRDYFPPGERDRAEAALAELARTLTETHA